MASHPRSQSNSGCTDDAPEPIRSMHDVFSNWDRCAILYHLNETSGPADLDDVATHLVAWSRGDEEPDPRDETVADAVKPHVVHAHVQRLDEFGIVDYDPRDESVSLSNDAEIMVSPPWTAAPEQIESDVMRLASESASIVREQSGEPPHKRRLPGERSR